MVMVHVSYYLGVKPFTSSIQNFLSVFNEFVVLVLIMLTLTLAAYADDTIGIEIGQFMVYCILFAWIINMFVIIVSQLKHFIQYVKKKYYRRKYKSKPKSGTKTTISFDNSQLDDTKKSAFFLEKS